MVKIKHEAEESSSSGGISTQSSSSGRKSQRRKSSSRKLSSSSIDNMDEMNPSKKVKLDTVEERGRAAVGDHDGGTKREGKGKEKVQALTFAPLPLALPLTANSEVSN